MMVAQHGYYRDKCIVLAYERILTGGTVFHNEDDSYTVVLDQNGTWEQAKLAFDEEIFHIENKHLEQKDANKAELEAARRLA